MQEATENQMSPEQLKRLIGDLQEEVGRVEGIKRGAEFRARRYNEITSRVNFLKKKPGKIQRDLRRLYVANRYVDRCIEALNQLGGQIDQYSQQLKAMS